MQQPFVEKPQNQLLSWFVLIAGGLFLIPTLPYTLLLIFMPLWKPDEISVLSMLFTAIPAGICVLAIWAMRWAYRSLHAARKINEQVPEMQIEPPEQEAETEKPFAAKKPVWPWLIIVPGAWLLVSARPGAMMLPIMPLYLAAMSTDSGTVPGYVPVLLVVVGYALIFGYAALLVKAVKTLRKK